MPLLATDKWRQQDPALETDAERTPVLGIDVITSSTDVNLERAELCLFTSNLGPFHDYMP